MVAVMLATGCASTPTFKTQVVEIRTPVLYSPRPPILDRPDLIIHELSVAERRDPGTVAKYYKATVLQLLGYTEELESVLESYKVIANTLNDNDRVQRASGSVEIQ